MVSITRKCMCIAKIITILNVKKNVKMYREFLPTLGITGYVYKYWGSFIYDVHKKVEISFKSEINIL